MCLYYSFRRLVLLVPAVWAFAFLLQVAVELAIFRHRPFAALGFEAEMFNSDDLLTEQNKRDDLLTEQTKALGLLREQS